MNAGASDHRDDDQLSVEVLVSTAKDDNVPPTRLLKIVRDHRTKDVEVLLPERDDILATGWVPEITYDTSGDGYQIRAVIRPDLDALRRESTPMQRDEGARAHTDERMPANSAPPVPHDSRTQSPPPTKVLYEVSFRNREIAVNGFRLSRPNFNSENEVVFEYLFRHPNRRIELAEIEAALGRPLVKRLREVVRDLGFTSELRDIFFPGASKTAVEFVNPVTEADFAARGLRPPTLGKSRERKREKHGER